MINGQPVTPELLLADPLASMWLKTALTGALDRDPVDAANDAEALSQALANRADKALGVIASGE